jgi:hypothetical protein
MKAGRCRTSGEAERWNWKSPAKFRRETRVPARFFRPPARLKIAAVNGDEGEDAGGE